jgi:prepilin-type N-terminal cleavage/methylation domain-containing protein
MTGRPGTGRGAAERAGLRRRLRRSGFTLLEVLAALGLLAAMGLLASSAGHAMARLGGIARHEAAGLLAAENKLEELLALRASTLSGGHDRVRIAGVEVHRVWRVRAGSPEIGLWRVEVSARWEDPALRQLTLVGVAS